jgi:predicted nucleic acid-binding protein
MQEVEPQEVKPQDVVCNASPLIFIAKIGRLDLLDNYSVRTTSQVESEILKGLKSKREDAKEIIKYFEHKEIVPVKVTIIKDLPDFLGEGEKSVISLAGKKNIKNVLIDEARARAVARLKGLSPKGTLGILWDSFKKGIISKTTVETLSFELVEKGYRIKEEVFIEFLKSLKGLRS